MGRPVYPHELCDPDFSWLLTNFQESNPNYKPVERGCLPVVLICDGRESETSESILPSTGDKPEDYREIIGEK